MIFIGIFRGEAKPDPARAIVGLPVIFALIAHIAFGQYGWLSRYEVYAVAMMLMGTVFVYSDSLRALKAQRAKYIFLSVLIGMLGLEYFGRILQTPSASRNIYQQQYQMHRFATEYFPHPVAVNDLGWVAFRNDRYVLDLWGLGSEDARKLARTKTLTAASLQRLTRKQAIPFAMLYDEWFGKAIPTSWCRIAVLHTSRVTAASGDVAFYLLDRSRYPEMLSALAKFSSSLPRGASLSVPGCG